MLLGDVCKGCGIQQSVRPREAGPPLWACGQECTAEELSGENWFVRISLRIWVDLG